MLDKIAIFSKGGIVLWSATLATLQGPDPITELVKTVLLEVRLVMCFVQTFVIHIYSIRSVPLVPKSSRVVITQFNGRNTMNLI